MDKIIKEVKSVFLFFPPEEVFENPYAVLADYQGIQTFKLNKWRIILGEKGGMFFDDGKNPFYPGVICPIIVQQVAIIKRILISRLNSLKNPFILLWLNSFKREIREISEIELSKYYLKPNRYCRAVRELYRILELIYPKEYVIINTISMILEFDSPAYRFRFQAFFGNFNEYKLRINPRKEIVENLDYSYNDDENEKVKKHWKTARIVFNVLWFISFKFRRNIKKIIKEINLNEIRMDEADLFWQFR